VSDPKIHIDSRHIDVALLKSVSEQAAEQAVKKTFVAMGLDPEKPFEAQQDMVWLRSTRERCEGAGFRTLVTVIGLLVLGAASAFWIGLKAMLTGQTPGPHP